MSEVGGDMAQRYHCCPHCADDPLHGDELNDNHEVSCDLCEYEQRTRPRLAVAWDTAVQAFAWALDNGPSDTAASYALANNPYRTTPPARPTQPGTTP